MLQVRVVITKIFFKEALNFVDNDCLRLHQRYLFFRVVNIVKEVKYANSAKRLFRLHFILLWFSITGFLCGSTLSVFTLRVFDLCTKFFTCCLAPTL